MSYIIKFLFTSLLFLPALYGEELKGFESETIETTHQITIDKEKINYRAVAGTLVLKNEQAKPIASIFYVAYQKIETATDAARRPITFCFNGGPGSSSTWLHIGVLGPKKVILDEGSCVVPPYQLIDNPASLLPLSDLVFIDPVSTGYSKIALGEDPKNFHGFEEDVKLMAEFIRLYIAQNNRWSSPKFLAGESYGTTRAVGLVDYLYNQNHIGFNGLILISPVLNFLTIKGGNGNDLPYLLSLPSLAATAWYHQKLSLEFQKASLQDLLKEVEEFSLQEYSHALLLGDTLTEQDLSHMTQQLADYTGLSTDYIKRSNLRLHTLCFAKELLKEDDRIVGRFDSRIEGVEGRQMETAIQTDVSLDNIASGFNAALNDYLKRELKWEKNEEYKLLSHLMHWNYGAEASNQYLNVSEKLSDAIMRNPHLRVFVACGYYDLATPYFASDYTFNHLNLSKELQAHISQNYYEAGHLIYTHEPSMLRLNQDLSNFILSTCPAQEK